MKRTLYNNLLINSLPKEVKSFYSQKINFKGVVMKKILFLISIFLLIVISIDQPNDLKLIAYTIIYVSNSPHTEAIKKDANPIISPW